MRQAQTALGQGHSPFSILHSLQAGKLNQPSSCQGMENHEWRMPLTQAYALPEFRAPFKQMGATLPTSPPFILEGELRAELNVARVVTLRCHKPEGRVAGIKVDPRTEVRMV